MHSSLVLHIYGILNWTVDSNSNKSRARLGEVMI